MNTMPPEPSAKDPISASFMKALMRYIRANTLLNGPGYRTQRGPNGTTLHIAHAKAVASPAKIPGCFEISGSEENEQGQKFLRFSNRYFAIGSKVYECEQDAIESPDQAFIVLVIGLSDESSPSASLTSVQSMSMLNAMANSQLTSHFIPLYQIGSNGSVMCDLRNMPLASDKEFF